MIVSLAYCSSVAFRNASAASFEELFGDQTEQGASGYEDLACISGGCVASFFGYAAFVTSFVVFTSFLFFCFCLSFVAAVFFV